ncbi:MAG TPA: Trk system potassium transport protein TrkA, partial [Sutterella sp.]|nr:Trk system potassium transport protein TrkA [Sutterella sp.]
RHVRRGDVIAAHSLRRGVAEALEVVAHGTPETSRVVGRTVSHVPLPEGVSIGALVRGSDESAKIIMAEPDLLIEAEDHVIIFVPNKRLIPKIEDLFMVDVGFF